MSTGLTWETEYDSVPKGVYQASFAFLGEELQDFEWSPLPRVFLRFKLPQGEASLSVAAGDELSYVVWQLTGRKMEVETPRNMFKVAGRLLDGFTWQGLVNVNKRGWVDRLQIPSGAYTFSFSRFSTRMKDGRAGWFEYKPPDGGDPRHLSVIDLVVDAGMYEGWLQTGLFPCTFKSDPQKGTIAFSGAALKRVMMATGLTQELLEAEVSAAGGVLAYFADLTNPMPEIEKLMIRLAEQGARLAGTVDQDGKTPWGALTPSGTVALDLGLKTEARPQAQSFGAASGRSEDEERLRALMTEISTRIWGSDAPVFDAQGRLTPEKGMYLAGNVIAVVADLFPDGRVKKFWPPVDEEEASNWTAEGVSLMVDVFAALNSEDEGVLLTLVGESGASHEALVEYVKKVWA